MAERPAGNDQNSPCEKAVIERRMMEKKQRSAESQRKQYEKWKATMERRHGKSISEIMRANGRVGGKKGHAGKGYSAHPEMASKMGRLGAAKRWAKYREAQG